MPQIENRIQRITDHHECEDRKQEGKKLKGIVQGIQREEIVRPIPDTG